MDKEIMDKLNKMDKELKKQKEILGECMETCKEIRENRNERLLEEMEKIRLNRSIKIEGFREKI